MFYPSCHMTAPSLGELEFIVLLVVAELNEDAYGAEIRREVSRRTGHDYSVGGVYASLQRLEEKAFLTSYESDPLPVRGGRSRRYFTVTRAGRDALQQATAAKRQFWEEILASEPHA